MYIVYTLFYVRRQNAYFKDVFFFESLDIVSDSIAIAECVGGMLSEQGSDPPRQKTKKVAMIQH
jgi:hypothetical protein